MDEDERHHEAMKIARETLKATWTGVIVAVLALVVAVPYRDIAGIIPNLLASLPSPEKVPMASNQAPSSEGGTNFSSIGNNVIASADQLSPFETGSEYLKGTLFGMNGILKARPHSENPNGSPLDVEALKHVKLL